MTGAWPPVAGPPRILLAALVALFAVLLARNATGPGTGRRGRRASTTPSQWLDGLTSALGVAAISSALFVGVIQAGTGGAALTVVTNLAYPIGDLVLLLVLGAVVGTGGRGADATWWILAVGLAIFGLGDSAYLLEAAEGTFFVDGVLDVVWPLSLVLFAAAAWQPRARTASGTWAADARRARLRRRVRARRRRLRPTTTG